MNDVNLILGGIIQVPHSIIQSIFIRYANQQEQKIRFTTVTLFTSSSSPSSGFICVTVRLLHYVLSSLTSFFSSVKEKQQDE